MGAREIHDGDDACGGCDRFNHISFDVGERCSELLPEPSRPAGTRGLPGSGVVISEVGVVSVLEWQGRIPHPCEGVEARLPAFGYFGRHESSPFPAVRSPRPIWERRLALSRYTRSLTM